ncbi:MAG: hypothetical protein WAL67_01195 [Candidatus Cybelea sp.]
MSGTFTIIPEKSATVQPGDQVTDSFTLEKKKSQPGHFFVNDVVVSSNQTPQTPIAIWHYALSHEGRHKKFEDLTELNEVLEAVEESSMKFSVTYTAPGSTSPLAVATTLTASLMHQGVSIDQEMAFVTDKVAASPAATGELATLAEKLYSDFEGFDVLSDSDIQKVLKHADTKVASIVNSKIPAGNVTPEFFAEALAVHDLVDDLYGKLLERAQPPEHPDEVP